MKDHIAIIDLGSNLTKLVVVKNSLPLNVLHRSVYDTKTLKNAPKGCFDASSVKQIERDIEQLLTRAKELHCNTFLGIATSAFRTRSNGQEVITNINNKYGINIHIIEGNREAKLIHKGALASVKPSHFPVMVMDIGGGSTEFIIGDENSIFWKHSFDFGSTALTNGLSISDPLSNENKEELQSRLDQFLPQLFENIKHFNPISFIGTTGAFESFAQIPETKLNTGLTVDSGYTFESHNLMDVLKHLTQSTTSERQQLPGLKKERIATIHIAAFILNYVLSKVSFKQMLLSLGDVKEGLALEYLESKSVN